MPSGGSRPRSGPVPDPGSERSQNRAWTYLPDDPDVFMLPAWPFPPARPEELKLWKQLWNRPQARMWAGYKQEHQVGQYVRALVASLDKEASPPLKSLVRNMELDLGLSIDGLLRRGWKLGADPATAPAETSDTKTAPGVRQTAGGNWLKGVKVRGGSAGA